VIGANRNFMKRVVIDTNVLIGWYKTGGISGDLDAENIQPVFSIITQIEALGFHGITKNEIGAITSMFNTGEVVLVDHEIAKQTIDIRQKVKIKTPDAIIAATALVNDAELWTANISDFFDIKGLKLHNPL
jgi:hypothetical protein